MVTFADISNNLDTDISNNLDDCSICFYPIITDKYVTDCSHTFHHTCIHEWSLHIPICHCPLCNFIINIPELNNEITTDEDTRIACITNTTLVDDIEFQRYQQHIREQRELLSNSNITQISPESNFSTIVVAGDYASLEGDDIQVTQRRTRTLIFGEMINAFILMLYSVYIMQLSLILFAFAVSVSHRKKVIDAKYFTLFIKILFILYSVSIDQNKEIDYNYDFYVSCFPWFTISLIK
jgi:hypothetical protein